MTAEEAAKMREIALNLENDRKNSVSTKKNKKSEAMAAKTWRDLIPVIKIDICSGRFVFGNRLTPTTLSICLEEAHCVYSTKPAASRLDHFMHFLKAKVDNAKVLLAPSPKYTGLVDDPPRYYFKISPTIPIYMDISTLAYKMQPYCCSAEEISPQMGIVEFHTTERNVE